MAMHPTLKRFLDWTWDHREELVDLGLRTGFEKGKTHMSVGKSGNTNNPGIIRLYDEYSARRAVAQGKKRRKANQGHIDKFCQELQGASRLTAQVELQLDEMVPVNLANLGQRDDIRGKFIHFPKTHQTTTHRIYVNVKGPCRGIAFVDILNRIWNIDGFTHAKVAVPGSERADNIVIWCKDAKAQEDVLAELIDVQNLNPGAFGLSLPKLVQPVQGVRGIGTGMEPPSMHPIRRGNGDFVGQKSDQSFGLYRCTLIFIALENTDFAHAPPLPPPGNLTGNGAGARNPHPPVPGSDFRKAVNMTKQIRKEQEARLQKEEFFRNVEVCFQEAGLSTEDIGVQEANPLSDIDDEAVPPPPPPPVAPHNAKPAKQRQHFANVKVFATLRGKLFKKKPKHNVKGKHF